MLGRFECLELDRCVYRDTRARLRGHLEAYGVGVGTSTGRCKGVSWRRRVGEPFWEDGFVMWFCDAL